MSINPLDEAFSRALAAEDLGLIAEILPRLPSSPCEHEYPWGHRIRDFLVGGDGAVAIPRWTPDRIYVAGLDGTTVTEPKKDTRTGVRILRCLSCGERFFAVPISRELAGSEMGVSPELSGARLVAWVEAERAAELSDEDSDDDAD